VLRYRDRRVPSASDVDGPIARTQRSRGTAPGSPPWTPLSLVPGSSESRLGPPGRHCRFRRRSGNFGLGAWSWSNSTALRLPTTTPPSWDNLGLARQLGAALPEGSIGKRSERWFSASWPGACASRIRASRETLARRRRSPRRRRPVHRPRSSRKPAFAGGESERARDAPGCRSTIGSHAPEACPVDPPAGCRPAGSGLQRRDEHEWR
jgi:hypothetical protein